MSESWRNIPSTSGESSQSWKFVHTQSNISESWRNIPSTSGESSQSSLAGSDVADFEDFEFFYDHKPPVRKIIYVSAKKVLYMIGNNGSHKHYVQQESGATVIIGLTQGQCTEVTLVGKEEAITKACNLIKKLVHDVYEPINRENNSPHLSNQTQKYLRYNLKGEEFFDWGKFYKYHDEYQRVNKRFSVLIKDFYKEFRGVAEMTPEEIEFWRYRNNIRVKKYYDMSGILPILNPVTELKHAFFNFPGLLNAITKQGYETPTALQSQVWPVLLSGEDVITIAIPGSGKTMAYLLPAFVHIKGQIVPIHLRDGPNVLILTPTDQRAAAIHIEVKNFRNVNSMVIKEDMRVMLIPKQVNIIISTPDRINELMLSRYINVDFVSYVVLDDAHMLIDKNFDNDIKNILYYVRSDRQTIISANYWPIGVEHLIRSYMNDPVQITIRRKHIRIDPFGKLNEKGKKEKKDNKDLAKSKPKSSIKNG